MQQFARRRTNTLAPVLVQFSTLILIIISIRAKMTSFTRPIFRAFCCRPIFRASFSRPYILFGWNGNATQAKISWTCTDVFRINENVIQQLSATFSCRDSKDGELSYLVTHVMSFSTNPIFNSENYNIVNTKERRVESLYNEHNRPEAKTFWPVTCFRHV